MANTKCTYIFAAINRNTQKSKLVMLRIQAISEASARSFFSSQYTLYFAGRIASKEAAHG